MTLSKAQATALLNISAAKETIIPENGVKSMCELANFGQV